MKKELVLVVDDEQSILDALTDKLRLEGLEVFKIHNGKDALDWALENKPGLIVTDLMMPVMDGREMLTKLREDSWGAEVPVIILSNIDDTATINSTIGLTDKKTKNKLNDYFVKSNIKLEELVKVIKGKL